MHPTLFHYGFITIHTYGLLVATAFYLGITLSAKQAEKEGIDPEKIMDLGLYAIISAIVGSRSFFVLRNYKSYVDAPIDAFKVWEGGLVFYGGLMLVVPVCLWFMKKESIPLVKCTDILVPYISLGQSIGRLGCFAAGCCYGSQTNVPWSVVYTNADSLAPLNIHLHPSQIYSFVLNLSVFLALLWIYKNKSFPGQVSSCYLILYPIVRFTVENFRSDPRGSVTIFGVLLSTSQFVSILTLIFGISLFVFFRKRHIAAHV